MAGGKTRNCFELYLAGRSEVSRVDVKGGMGAGCQNEGRGQDQASSLRCKLQFRPSPP